MAKLTKKSKRNLRNKIKVNSVLENKFVIGLLKGIKSQVNKLFKTYNSEDYNSYFNILNFLDFTRFNKKSKNLGNDILKKNYNGFMGIFKAISEGLKQNKNNEFKKSEFDKKFKRGVNSLAKEKQIFKPLIDKFAINISKIKNVTKDVEKILRKAYLKGENLRGTEFEELLYDKLKGRAKLIVRTESAKINAAFTEVRAQTLNMKAYIWSSSKDQRTRPSHREMEGVLVFWNDAPELDKMKGHCGEYPNCRCVSIVVFELDDIQFPIKVAENLHMESVYNKQTHKYDKVKITQGRIKTYNKQEFINRYGIYFK